MFTVLSQLPHSNILSKHFKNNFDLYHFLAIPSFEFLEHHFSGNLSIFFQEIWIVINHKFIILWLEVHSAVKRSKYSKRNHIFIELNFYRQRILTEYFEEIIFWIYYFLLETKHPVLAHLCWNLFGCTERRKPLYFKQKFHIAWLLFMSIKHKYYDCLILLVHSLWTKVKIKYNLESDPNGLCCWK